VDKFIHAVSVQVNNSQSYPKIYDALSLNVIKGPKLQHIICDTIEIEEMSECLLAEMRLKNYELMTSPLMIMSHSMVLKLHLLNLPDVVKTLNYFLVMQLKIQLSQMM